MLVLILLILIVLWLLGYGPLTALSIPLITIGGRVIDLWDLFIFLVVVWLIGALPSPLRQIAGVALGIWLLSLFGFIAIAGLSNIIILSIILGLVLYIVGGR